MLYSIEVRAAKSLFRLLEAVDVQVAEGNRCIWSGVRVLEEPAGSDADIEVVPANVGTEKWEDNLIGGTAPEDRAHDSQDKEVVEHKEDPTIHGGAWDAGLVAKSGFFTVGHFP